MKFSFFSLGKNSCVSHGQVFVMDFLVYGDGKAEYHSDLCIFFPPSLFSFDDQIE